MLKNIVWIGDHVNAPVDSLAAKPYVPVAAVPFSVEAIGQPTGYHRGLFITFKETAVGRIIPKLVEAVALYPVPRPGRPIKFNLLCLLSLRSGSTPRTTNPRVNPALAASMNVSILGTP